MACLAGLFLEFINHPKHFWMKINKVTHEKFRITPHNFSCWFNSCGFLNKHIWMSWMKSPLELAKNWPWIDLPNLLPTLHMTQTISNIINTPFRDLVEFAFFCLIGFTAGFMGIVWIFLLYFLLSLGLACFISGACFGELYREMLLQSTDQIFKI